MKPNYKKQSFRDGVLVGVCLAALCSFAYAMQPLQNILKYIPINPTPAPAPVPTPTPAPIPSSQWAAFGGNEPAINGSAWDIPCCSSNVIAGYFYTQLPAVPKQGQILTLNYSVTGDNPVWQNNPAGGDYGAPTIHLLLWRNGDNDACDAVTKQYRMFGGRTPLVLGSNQQVSVLLDPSVWTGCYADLDTTAQFADLLSNLKGAGVTFGGQDFAGHGLYLSSGSAKFSVDGFGAK